jgi:RHS repeat-associated protein
VITYQVPPAQASLREPYGSPIYKFDLGTDFSMAGRPYGTFTASAAGDLEVSSCFEKDPTADDVTVKVIHKRGGAVLNTYQRALLATDTGSFCVDLPHPLAVQYTPAGSSSSETFDALEFRVESDAQIDPKTLRWPAAVAYQSYCRIHPTTRAPICGTPTCAAGFCNIGPSDPLPRFPIPQGLVQTPVEVFYPVRQWTASPPEDTRTFVVGNGGTPAVSWTLSTGRTVGGTFVPGPRMLVLVQGVNRLIKKTLLDASNRSVTISESPSLQSGDQLFFTVFFPDGAPQQGQAFFVGTPTVDGATAPFNLRVPDPTLDNNGVAQVDPMSGGYHRWFYGDWNGDQTFNDAQIRVVSNPQKTDTFMFTSPAPFGITSRPDLGPTPLWLGRGVGEFIGAARIHPGFSSAGSSTGNASNASSLRSSDTWNLDLKAQAAVIGADLNAGDSTTNLDFFDVNGDRLPDSVSLDQVQYNQGVVDPTTGQGAFADRQPVAMGFGDLRSTTNGSFRLGFDAGGVGHMINMANAKSKTSKHVDTSVVSASTDYGLSSTRTDFLDVNGDGLPDHVSREPGSNGDVHVRLNLGYAFSQEILWPSPGWTEDHVSPTLSVFGEHNVASDLTSDLVDAALDALDLIPGHELRIKSTNVLRLSDSQTNNASVGIPGGSFGAGGGPNVSQTRQLVDFVDLNGDDLPDQVLRDPNEPSTVFHVKLNLGGRFGQEQTWVIPDWSTDPRPSAIESLPHPDGVGWSTMAGWAASVHFEICYFICVGFSAFYSRDNGGANVQFDDVDGDGKPDQVLKKVDDPTVHVKLNKIGKTNLLRAVHRPLGGTIALDYKRVGNVVALDQSPRIDMPTNQWALASVTVKSGQAASEPAAQVHTIEYTATSDAPVVGFFDRQERESYGYADVKTIFNDGSSIAHTYDNQDYYQKELPTSTIWNQTESQPPLVSQVLERETYTYADPEGKDPSTQPARTGTLFPAARNTDTFFIEVDPAGRSKHHQEIKQYDKLGNLTDVADSGDFDFGDPGDDLNYHIDYVHPDAAGLITRPSAITATTGLGVIFGAAPGTLLRQRSATYSVQGKPLTVTDTIVGGKDPATGAPRDPSSPAAATWTITYDAFGNVDTATGPEGHAFAYEYDVPTKSYRTKNTDASFQYVSTSDYDLRFGLPKSVVDLDGSRQETDFDDFGRIVQVFGPKDFDATTGARTTPSLVFDYSEQPHAAGGFVEALPASATTSHKNVVPSEMSRPGDPIPVRPPIRTVTFADGLARTIQTKKDITRDDGQGNVADGMSVSGAVVFDVRGRVAQQGQPVPRAASAAFVDDVPMLNPTTFAYDALSRERQVARPDSSSVDAAAHGNQAVTTISYQLGEIDGKLYLLKLVQDPRGEVRSLYRSVREELVAVDQVNKIRGTDNVHLVTRYAYDPLSQLVTVTDANENVTTTVYDTVGKMVALTSPDAGLTEWRYDRAGNMTVRETPNLRAVGKLINYIYNKDRLERVDYPTSADVKYIYGDASEAGADHGFVAGRIKTRIDESGQVDFAYDGLGNVVKETSALVSLLPSQPNGYQAVMTYSYDSFGRMIEMKFPGTSAEIVRYGYDAGGLVTSARGLDTVVKSPNKSPDNPYFNHIGYDEFEQRTRCVYGNGIETKYAYEPETRRLSHLDTDFLDKKTLQPMQRLRYAYDVTSNVRTLRNDVPVNGKITPVTVGPTSYTFDYDRQYQLTHVDGLYQTSSNNRSRHSLDYVYDEISNIAQKTQKDFQDQTGKNGIFQEGNAIPQTTYDLGYSYARTPHAVTHVDESLHQNLMVARDFAHDADGNQTGWTLQNGQQRVETWSEEDRLRQVQDQGHLVGQYLYRADGTRTHNFSDGRELVYVNQYLNLRNNGPYITKHIYAGNLRIASRLDGDASPPSTTFFYHPDHMQSTQYTTIDDGSLAEHVEYFASGEPWREERTNLLADIRPEFLFDGKELDTLTGFYYYGARYYDPVVQNWQSTDPILPDYVRRVGRAGQETGEAGRDLGADDPMTLALYTFARHNPLHFTDPDGRDALPDPGAPEWYKKDFQKAKAYLMKSKEGRHLFAELKKKPDFFVGPNTGKEKDSPLSGTTIRDKQPIVTWASRFGQVTRENDAPTGTQSPALGLLHELEHALGYLEDPEAYNARGVEGTGTPGSGFTNAEDERVVKGPETSAAKELGEGTRDTNIGHMSDFFPVEGPTQGGRLLRPKNRKK